MKKRLVLFELMRKKTLVLLAIVGIGVLFFLHACINKDDFDFDKIAETKWNPEFAVPLVYSSLTIQDILYNTDEDGYFQYGADNFVTLVYQGNVLSSGAFNLVPLPDQAHVQSFSLTNTEITNFISAGTYTNTAPATISFVTASPTTEIDSVKLSDGDLVAQINSDFQHSGNLKITFPTAKKNGQAFVADIPFPAATGSPAVVNPPPFDLTGYTFDLTNPSFNELPITYTITLNYSGNPISSSDELEVKIALQGMEFEKIFGFFGQDLAIPVTEDTSKIKIFDNVVSGNLRFQEPKITFIINNSFGIPVKGNFNTIYAHSLKNSVDVNITGIPNPLPINFPNYSQVGQSVSTSVIIDKNNSNIKQVIDTVPKFIAFKLDAIANYTGGPSVRNFITNQSKFKVDVDVELPLFGSAQNVVFQDTLDFTLDTSISELERALFRIYSSNGFPMDAMVQVYFYDSANDIKIDSLITPYQQFIASGTLDANYKVTAPTTKVIEVEVNKDRLEKLGKADKLLVRGEVETPNNGQQNVKIYSDYRLDVKLGIKAKFNVVINGNKND